ncbi:cytochrome c oxidase assembly protein COX19 [Nilaparvata lugens]|uniref:cytochrome c oxidase assembly protein COX19 n=1 Tax=Nilaparvata lugens TaxID=108931 RepID=UPI00193CF23F|nr:cytochrome c oxidase assembly protein COX19 [Nilaparvata lugens]
MSVMTFGMKKFNPTAPDKGSFPLDHEGLCKKEMIKYMMCINQNNKDNSACRQQAKDYLGCRMDNNLMSKEEWSKLGFSESEDTIEQTKSNK